MARENERINPTVGGEQSENMFLLTLSRLSGIMGFAYARILAPLLQIETSMISLIISHQDYLNPLAPQEQ